MISANAFSESHWLRRFGRDKRLLLAGGLIVLLAFSFWSGSRYPALSEKAAMGIDTRLAALGFEVWMPVQADDPLLRQVLYTTLNWINTNRQGMTFGVLLAPALMVMLSLFRRHSYHSGMANTLLGIVIGAPLGVCVNCAAPIAQGLRAAGARIETMLASMFSSPTLNVVILTMLFALFPTYMVLIKIGLTLAFILLAVPLLSRWLPARPVTQLATSGPSPWQQRLGMSALFDPALTPDSPAAKPMGWWPAILWLGRSYIYSLWFIVKTTVPLMLLAGFLGALLITLLPWNTLSDLTPKLGYLMTLLAMSGVALVGVFLPVPIAFDVIIVAILLEAGMPVKYAMVLLFTLGIYSIYPFFIVWRSVSWQMAIALFVALAGLGVLAGMAGHEAWQWAQARQEQLFFTSFQQASGVAKGPTMFHFNGDAHDLAAAEVLPYLRKNALTSDPPSAPNEPSLTVARQPLQTRLGGSDTGFQFFRGSEFGLTPAYSLSIRNQILPYSGFRGIASGDIHHDGWVDVLLTSEKGLFLYANDQGKAFIQQAISIPGLADYYVVNAALVDLNNDGWLDIFFATYRQGNYVIYSQAGDFRAEQLQQLPNAANAVMSASAAFGDIDRDGDLDIFLGNWSLGERRIGLWAPQTSRNVLLRQQADDFEVAPLNAITGETLSSLLSDFDDDGDSDLVVGDDFESPDTYYLGDGQGQFIPVTRQDALIPHSTQFTMSIHSADIDNDLQPELYIGQITDLSLSTDPVHAIADFVCDEFAEPSNQDGCRQAMRFHNDMVENRWPADVFACAKMDNRDLQRDCIAYHILQVATLGRGVPRQDLCALFPAAWDVFSFVCQHNYTARDIPTSAQQEQSIPPLLELTTENVLLKAAQDGGFEDHAQARGISYGGWTWNAKFADLDNDEWQDLYIANGMFIQDKRESNLFYRNRQGYGFSDDTAAAGLTAHSASSAYTYIDIDNDGDLDIILRTALGPVGVYINNTTTGNAIGFELRDHIGNRFGIGSKVIIHYGANAARHQMREIQASGGFISFDAPIAHFGLGDYDKVSRVEILWSTGERSMLAGPFATGSRYIVTRQVASDQ